MMIRTWARAAEEKTAEEKPETLPPNGLSTSPSKHFPTPHNVEMKLPPSVKLSVTMHRGAAYLRAWFCSVGYAECKYALRG